MESNLKKIHFVGVGGVGMGTFAVALAQNGYEITGSDIALYEPMKSVLSRANVKLIEGFQASTLESVKPDMIVIGNVVRKENPEVRAWLQTDIKFMSFPEAVRSFLIQDKNSIVCAGTHGKTTTTSWVAYLLAELGKDPTYLIGGVPANLPSGCTLTAGDLFVGEGDEYDSAFFDKGPKFLHYNPHYLILTSIEFDHADIYRDLDHVKSSFEKLIALLPGDGLCIARFDDPVVMNVVTGCLCPVQTFGTGSGAMWRLGKVEEDSSGYTFEVIYKNRPIGIFKSPMMGEHNLLNILSGIVVAANLGIPVEKVKPIVESFRGAKRRQELLLQKPITLVDDFAHHPTEVKASLKAVRKRFPEGKLWALFEPRSATARRSVHQDDYAKAFECADHILIGAPIRQAELGSTEKLSTDVLTEALTAQGKHAQSFASADEIVQYLVTHKQDGDIVLVMSNGEFGKIQEKIVKALA